MVFVTELTGVLPHARRPRPTRASPDRRSDQNHELGPPGERTGSHNAVAQRPFRAHITGVVAHRMRRNSSLPQSSRRARSACRT
jgi:hypothetical protein